MKIEVYSPTIRRKEMDAVLTSMVEEKIGPGEQAARLSALAKELLPCDFCLAVRSPATALYMALQLLNLNEGDGVAVSTLSPWYYDRVLAMLRLSPVFCDASLSTGLLSPEAVHKGIEQCAVPDRVRALVVHHTLGLMADMPALLDMGLPTIEDCSLSFGSTLGGRPAGSFGQLAILGLEEHDMLTAGCGALLFAAERRNASVLRNNAEMPAEFALPDMNAVMAAVQFKESKRNLERRAEIAAVYAQAASRTRHKMLVRTDGSEYNNYAFPLVLETGFKDVAAYAKRKDIEVAAAFAGAFSDTLMGRLIDRGTLEPALYQESYSLSLRTVLFPLYPRLTSKDVEAVAKLIQTLP